MSPMPPKAAPAVAYEMTQHVRDACLCLHTHRAARSLARRFDEAFRPLGITHGQFSLLMAVNRPESPTMGEVASLLAVDRTTLTASLKPLERDGLIAISADAQDRRTRRVALTRQGESVLEKAAPIWCDTHRAIETDRGGVDFDALRAGLRVLG